MNMIRYDPFQELMRMRHHWLFHQNENFDQLYGRAVPTEETKSAGSVWAQQRGDVSQRGQGAPVISINIERSIQTIDYRTKGSTRIDFRGTALAPQAKGEAKIDHRRQSREEDRRCQAEFDGRHPSAVAHQCADPVEAWPQHGGQPAG